LSGENIERLAATVDSADIVAVNDLPVECPQPRKQPRKGAFQQHAVDVGPGELAHLATQFDGNGSACQLVPTTINGSRIVARLEEMAVIAVANRMDTHALPPFACLARMGQRTPRSSSKSREPKLGLERGRGVKGICFLCG